MTKKISIVVPTYNEEENVVPLSEQIIDQLNNLDKKYDYELIFIDNNSGDSTRDKIRKLCIENPRIKAIFNAKNYGQFSSPYYGLLQATGDCAILMSADFQDPVELIPIYVKEWESGHKIVLGQKISSKEKRILYVMRSLYYKLMKTCSETEFIEHVTGAGLYDREFIDVLRTVDEPRPFLRGMVAEMGYGIKLVPFEQPLRKAGKSSNSISKYYDAAVQGMTSYTKTGVRVAVFLGIVFTILSVFSTICLTVYKILNWDTYRLWPSGLMIVIFVVASLQLLFIGVVGEYVLNVNSKMNRRPLVIESERINFK